MKIFKLNPAVHSTYGSVDLTSLSSFALENTGDETSAAGDGSAYVTNVFVDNIAYSITVNGTDIGFSFKVGDCDDLVLHAIERANDCGGAATTKTYTFAKAVVTAVNRTVNHSGNSEYSITFKAYSSDGIASPVVIS